MPLRHLYNHSCDFSYTVSADNCDSAKIVITLPSCDYSKARDLAHLATKSFRDVKVTNDQTGEVVMSEYKSDEWFVAAMRTHDCVHQLLNKYYGVAD